jgi:hypothetical protein
MTNLPAQAVNSDEADRVAKLIQDALGSTRPTNAREVFT